MPILKQENIIPTLGAILVLLMPIYLVYHKLIGASPVDRLPYEYVGRETCIQCHTNEYQSWKGSHHDKAMDVANGSTVLGNFSNVSLISKDGTEHRFYKKDNRFYVYTNGTEGNMQEFEIKYTFGYTPLQNYLVEFPGGRLQTLPLTWNTVDNNWYHMADSIYKNENIDHHNWLHWTNQAQNWNSMCADCHSTNVKKNYNVKTDSYHTTYSEIDVSCEACHGPASKHLEWANLPEYSRDGFENFGLPVQTSNIDNKAFVDQCARCHSRRATVDDYRPSNASIFNHMHPTLPVEPDYFIDGQILDEVYVYGSFTQSKMYMHDVKCNDCHNSHSGERLLEGNKLCLQCHKADDYDTKAHHFHKSKGEPGKAVVSESGVEFKVGSGTECINCHMHGRYYMGIDYRNDHSFRVPRPDLSESMGIPNACTQCHATKSNTWAQSYIEKWYGKSRHFQYGQAFYKAKKGEPEGLKLLRKIISDELYPEIIRATAIQSLGMNYQDSSKTILFQMLQHLNPLFRYTALQVINITDRESLMSVLPLLNDETKVIRIECATKLMVIPKEQIPDNYLNAIKTVEMEQLVALEYNADFPLGKYNLGNYYFNNQQLKQAEKFYLDAIKTDEELHFIKVNLAYLYNIQGDSEKASLYFQDYLKHNSNDGNVLFSYGLLLAELKKYKESLAMLIKASKASPDNARIFYNIGQLYDFMGNVSEAERYLLMAIKKEPGNQSYISAQRKFYAKHNIGASEN